MKTRIIAAVTLAVLLAPLAASAETVTFEPTPGDLYDLDHSYAFSWRIQVEDEVLNSKLESASIHFDRLRNWSTEPNTLYLRLLDTAGNGVDWFYDHQASGDYFAGQGIELVTYQNLSATPQDITYTFTDPQLDTLSDYIANGGDFALTFDPDCHYYNCGVSMELGYGPTDIPEPATMSVLAIGGALAFFRRRRRLA